MHPRFPALPRLAVFAVVCCVCMSSAATLKLYWLGNSFTGNLYGLHNVVREMINAGSIDDTVLVSEASIKWGQNLDAQFNDATVMERVRTGDFTHIILQGYEPEGGNATTTIDYGYRIAQIAKTAGKIPVIFVSHANYLRVDRYDSVSNVFSILADSADAPKVPAFTAWRAALAERPGFMLWALSSGCDGHHQGDQGQYLDACAFYSYFTGESPQGLTYRPSTSSVTASQASFLQRVGWEAWRAQVRGDSLAPRIAYATGFAWEGVTVQMNEPVDAATAQVTANWSLSPDQAIQSASVQPGGARVFLSMPGLAPGSYIISVHGVGDTLTSHNVMTATVQCTLTVPARSQWTSTDIGHPFVAGSTLQATSTAVTLVTTSLGTNNSYDQMRFAYKRCRGDFSFTTRVASITNHGSSRSGGIMVRESDDPASRMVGTWWPWNAPIITARRAYGATPTDFGWGTQVPTATPYWMRLTRTGNTFVYSISQDATTWSATGTTTLALHPDVLLGLTASSGNCDVDTVAFDNVTVNGEITAVSGSGRPAIQRPTSASASRGGAVYSLRGELLRQVSAGTMTPGCYLIRWENGMLQRSIGSGIAGRVAGSNTN